MTGEKDLASAICTRIDSLPKESKKLLSVTKSDLAELLMRDELMEAKAAIGLADIHAGMAELAVREATGSKVRPEEKIGLDLRVRELESELGVKLEDLADEPKTIVNGGTEIKVEDQRKPAEKSEHDEKVDAFHAAMDANDWVACSKVGPSASAGARLSPTSRTNRAKIF